jgi:choline dehydrogenase-like flavoprotein
MQSGIGDQVELQRFGIPLVQHLSGVGQNFQDHFGVSCIWEYPQPVAPHNNACEATFFWKSHASRMACPKTADPATPSLVSHDPWLTTDHEIEVEGVGCF